ncbi:MAG TPA: DUF58 domain-containing protein [Terriglobales bacterium]|nr:DUF58 domain-containing protein [Terriglobales bacterium]
MSQLQPLAPVARSERAVARGRFGLAFGDRFFVLLLAGLLWIGPIFWSRQFIYGLVAWDVALLIAWFVDLRSLGSPAQLLIDRTFTRALALEEPTNLRLTITNSGRSRLHVQAVDDLPPELISAPVELSFSVPAGQERTAEYMVVPKERGDYWLGPLYLRCQSPIALAQRWEEVDLRQQVRVYPSLQSAKRNQLFLLRSRRIELERRLLRQQGQGKEFEYLRDFREGDEFRDICWTATARRGKHVTRVHRAERNQAVWMVMDCGRLMRARIGSLSKLDFAVDAALNLAQVAAFGGDRVALLAYGARIQERLTPGRGHSHMRLLLDQLARIHGEPSEADHLRAASSLMGMQTRRCLILWITDLAETAMTPEVVQAAMQMSGRHIILFAVIGQPDLKSVAAESPNTPEELYRYTAAIETLHRRELLLARMRERGALAMEVDAHEISAVVMNKYLELKERGQF